MHDRPTPKAHRTRTRILAAAQALFQEHGFERTTMRDIANRSQLSAGATYYYFRTKEDLVFAFYAERVAQLQTRHVELVARTKRFEERFGELLRYELELLQPQRDLVTVLARNAIDPRSQLSPFSPNTAAEREAAIRWVREALAGSDLKVHSELQASLPRFLWLYKMGVIFFWCHDASPGQQATQRLIDTSLQLLLTTLRMTTMPLPGMSTMVQQLVALLGVADDPLTQASSEKRRGERSENR